MTVTRGASGERHGNRTLGGAIHLQTRKLHDKETFLHLEGAVMKPCAVQWVVV